MTYKLLLLLLLQTLLVIFYVMTKTRVLILPEQRDRRLRKMYLAVTKEPVPLGMHLHWMWAPQNQRGKTGGPPCQLVSHTPPESRRKARVRAAIFLSIFTI